jgi:hypothetical protein
MKMGRTITAAGMILVVASVICACGGKGARFLEAGTQAMLPVISWEGNPQGLRQTRQVSYDYSSYPSEGGFTVVPMLDELAPKAPGCADYSLTVETRGAERVVRLTSTETIPASGDKELLAHLRFDPSLWELAGVGSLSPWAEVDNFGRCLS